MKKILVLTLCLSTVCGVNVSALGWSQTITPYFNSLTLYVNGKEMLGDTILYQGTTYVPIRAAATALGGDVWWNESTRSAYITTKRTDYIADVIQWCDTGDNFENCLSELSDCSVEYCCSETYRDEYYELMMNWLKYAKEDFYYMSADTEIHLKLRYIGVDIDSDGVKNILDELYRYLNDFETYAKKIVEVSGNASAVCDLMSDKWRELSEYDDFIIEWKSKALSKLYDV